jgi:hypothetical protein
MSQQLMLPFATGGQLFWQSVFATQTGTQVVPPWHAPLHVWFVPHGMQVLPPLPHAEVLVPARQVVPLQHPLHDDVSHTHVPAEHRWPERHVPVVHVPPQPSLAPHGLPAHDGAHVVLPQMLGALAPQVRLAGHAPQSMLPPQWPTILPQ